MLLSLGRTSSRTSTSPSPALQLRRRLEHGKNIWQLKLPREDSRVELEAEGGPACPPPELAGVLRASLDGRQLRPVAKLRTQRTGRRVDGAEVTLDAVEVLEGERVASRFAEIEAELGADEPRQLAALEAEVANLEKTSPPSGLAYAEAVRYLALSTEWSRATAAKDFGPVASLYAEAEPKAAGLVDNVLRSSVALPLAARLDPLVADANRAAGIRHARHYTDQPLDLPLRRLFGARDAAEYA